MLRNNTNYYFEPFKTSLKIVGEAIKFVANISCLTLENAGKIGFNLLITSSATILGLASYNSIDDINKVTYKAIDDVCGAISGIGDIINISEYSKKIPTLFWNLVTNASIGAIDSVFYVSNYLSNKIFGMEEVNKEMEELAEHLNMKNNNEYLKYALCIVSVSTILITLYNSKSEESLAIKNNIKENVNNFFSLSYKLFTDLFSNTDEKIDNILVKSTNELNENFDNIVKNNLDDVVNNSSNLCENLSDNVIIDDVLTNCDSNIDEVYDIDNIGDVSLD